MQRWLAQVTTCMMHGQRWIMCGRRQQLLERVMAAGAQVHPQQLRGGD
jgi:hypothetical protein